MSLPIGTALRDGFFKVASRAGAILIAAYLVVNGLSLVAINSAMKAYIAENAPETQASLGPALDLPPAVGAALFVLSSLLAMYVSVVAMRTFVADARGSFRNVDLTGGIALALVNLLVGYVVYSIAVAIGWVLIFVPGIFLMVVLTFWPLYVVVEGDNFITAMRRSWNLTEGSRIALFALGLVVVGLGFAVGMVVGIGAFIGALAGVSQALISVLQIVVVTPVSLYSLGVLASAFNLLREESDELGGESTSADVPSTPA